MTEDDFTAQLEAGFEKGMEADMARLEGMTANEIERAYHDTSKRRTPVDVLSEAMEAVRAARELASDVTSRVVGDAPETQGGTKLALASSGCGGMVGEIESLSEEILTLAHRIRADMDRIRERV